MMLSVSLYRGAIRFGAVFALVMFSFAWSMPAVQFAGLWRNGSDANYVDYGLDVPSLTTLVNQRFNNNLRMASLRSYVDGGSRVRVICGGVRPGLRE